MADLQITIDDGPEPVDKGLNPILAELEKRKVVAAFFCIGQEMKTSPDAVKTILKKNHVIGNHSFDHLEPKTSGFMNDQILESFKKAHQQLITIAGVEMKHWRALSNRVYFWLSLTFGEWLTASFLKGAVALFRLSRPVKNSST